ncbi:hypothetical protein B0H14DRAFT_2570906 [Mycena olivaceomarginata]|nr:hypothetical protein B0H14DRAFT_2570906 [Mycena olivaceomarginata]
MLVLGPPPVVIQEDRRAESRRVFAWLARMTREQERVYLSDAPARCFSRSNDERGRSALTGGALNGPTTMYDGINAQFADHNVVAYLRGSPWPPHSIPMGRGVAVHAKRRKWQWGEGGKEMVAMGGGRAAGAPLDEGMHGRKGCTRNMWAVPARSSLPRRDEFRCAGWPAGVYRAQAVQDVDVARGHSVRSLVERIRGAGYAAYTTGWSAGFTSLVERASASAQDSLRQRPGYHQTRHPSPRPPWRREAYLGPHLRRDPRRARDLLRERDSVTYTKHAKRKTVTALDVVYALKRSGRTLYGFGA